MANLFENRNITNAQVYIDGKETGFVSLIIEQSFGEHHHFVLVTDYDAPEDDFLSNPLKQINLLGKWVYIDLQQGDNSENAYEFRGIIDNIMHEGASGKHGHLIIEGKSPTVLLERGKRLNVFSNMTLQEVFKEVVDDIFNNALSYINQPVYQSLVPFLMQYWESDWEFLQRLSVISGEMLYYTGYDLVFGAHKEFPEMEVMYDRELSRLCFGSRLLANTFNTYQYLLESDEIIEQHSPDRIENANEYVTAALNRGKQLVQKYPVRTPVGLPVEDIGSLNEMSNHRKVSTASETVYVTGTSKTCHPRIGRILKILIPEGISGTQELGTYRVLKVRHEIDQNHHYRCDFEAVPSGLKRLPHPKIQLPFASSIQARVVRNDDPQGLGRVIVEFPFANDMPCETWLQVMSPDAGGLVGLGSNKNGEVSKNRGMLFVPEVGDRVMVDFEFGDPNRPYVMGSLFHGKNCEGGGKGNNRKSIITKSGHTLEFDDSDECLGIRLKDKNGNEIHLDTKGKNMEITAPETINLNAKNIHLVADENLTLISGKDTNQSVGKDHILVISGTSNISVEKTLDISITGDMNLNAEKMLNQTIGKKLTQSAKSMEIKVNGTMQLSSQDELTLKSGSDVIIAQ